MSSSVGAAQEEGALGEELSAWQAVGRRTARRSAGNAPSRLIIVKDMIG